MLSTQHTQSLTDFRQKASETIERLNRTGEAEIITVNGEARAVLVAPVVFDEMSKELELARDVESIRKSMKQIEAGDYLEADEFFDELRAKLLSMKNAKKSGASK